MKIALTACFAITMAASATSAIAQDTAPLPAGKNLDIAFLADAAFSSDLPNLSTDLWSRPSDHPSFSEHIPAGIPLRVELDKSSRMRVGAQVQGHLIEAVYLGDHVVIPKGSKVYGTVTGKHSISGQARGAAMLNGDLTALKKAEVTFDALETPDGRHFQIQTETTERTTQVVHMSDDTTKPRRSLGQRIAAAFRWTKTQTVAALTMEHKGDKLRQMLYQEVPLHPQAIWAGTQYDAKLTEPLILTGQQKPAPAPTAELGDLKLEGTIEARLVGAVTSATAHTGTPIEAVLTQPLFESAPTVAEDVTRPQSKLLLPEGTRLVGTVVQAKAAGLFGQNGSLRLTFRKAELPQGDERVVHGQLTGAETEKDAHIKIDDEGGARATNGTHLFEPISLGALAAVGDNAGTGVVREAMAGNGMDLLTRVVGTAFSSAGLVTGLGYYEAAKVVFDQFIARGHDVVFQNNTRLEIELAQR
jgi:type IV secretory pathway VirB10-like protein